MSWILTMLNFRRLKFTSWLLYQLPGRRYHGCLQNTIKLRPESDLGNSREVPTVTIPRRPLNFQPRARPPLFQNPRSTDLLSYTLTNNTALVTIYLYPRILRKSEVELSINISPPPNLSHSVSPCNHSFISQTQPTLRSSYATS